MKKWITVLLLISMLIPAAAGAEEDSVYKWAGNNESLYYLGETGWLVEKPSAGYPKNTREMAEDYIRLAEKHGLEPPYVYLVNSSKSIDFDDPGKEPPLWTLLRECYPDSKMDCLEIGSIGEFCNYFYKTDHHWNYKGAYEGYREIIRLLLGEDEPLLEPAETVEFPFTFNGSFNKRLGRTDCDELFTVYRFEYPEMKIWLNRGRRNAIGKAQAYFAGKISSRNDLTNHYGEFYGGNIGLVQMCTDRPEKENVMIFSNSYECAVNMLVASHFNNTLVVDKREFEDELGGIVTVDDLIRQYGVTKILLMGDATFFRWW